MVTLHFFTVNSVKTYKSQKFHAVLAQFSLNLFISEYKNDIVLSD